MKRALAAAVALGAAMLGAAVAGATVGGPTVCEVLGWDARAQRIYVHEIPQHGGDAFGTVRYFDCAGAGEPVLHDEAWSRAGPREGGVYDADLGRRLKAVRARLACGLDVELDTFGGASVALAGAWRIPGRSERLVVLAFRGDPFEGGYEVQVPMIVQERGTSVRRVHWPGR